MNWISNYVRPTINSLFSRREVPENLWSKCTECGTMLFHRELSDNLNVCSNCDHHMPFKPRDRFKALFDKGLFVEIDVAEPTIPDAIKILNGLKSRYEDHHKVRFTGAALKTAVDLSARYINDRKLPDKAIDVIDEATESCFDISVDARSFAIYVYFFIDNYLSDI